MKGAILMKHIMNGLEVADVNDIGGWIGDETVLSE